ncbi:hypothetical protein [Hyphomicrobium sp. CS1BSMeth3]|uniref:hypothetical protein n=1 Tax=Hyphomicrobium sp. CS1BSMeth3 TaxID=1892844 RepID=UPI000930A169|nr:hypothetical protein [Hyphomicrobium sp. CS1BSMeth3]
MKITSNRKKTKKLKVAVLKPHHRRVLVCRDDGYRIIPRWERMREGPVVAAIQWVEKHADGFDRLALLIDAADYMNERRHIDSDAANHVAVGLTMLREELHELRKRLWA